jgi:hypothetical protein
MANWRKTKTPGVFVAHKKHCPAFAREDSRCRCEPSWRGHRWSALTGRMEWQKPVTKDRSEVLSWLAAGARAQTTSRSRSQPGRPEHDIALRPEVKVR